MNIDDTDVLEAIRFHTTGTSNWNAVGCALYIADYSEPNRPHPQAATAREIMTNEGFASALHYVARSKTEHVRETHGLDSHSDAFLEWIRVEYPI